jgi:hypothetical protein
MGMYATGQVFYGYLFDEDAEFPTDEDGERIEEFDLAEKILRELGVEDPWDSYPDTAGMDYRAQNEAHKVWYAAHKAEIDAWSSARTEIEKDINVEMSSFGHYEYSRACLEVKGTSQSASPSYPHALDSDFTYMAQWKRDLDEFLDKFDIEPPTGPNQPGWWLVASYG